MWTGTKACGEIAERTECTDRVQTTPSRSDGGASATDMAHFNGLSENTDQVHNDSQTSGESYQFLFSYVDNKQHSFSQNPLLLSRISPAHYSHVSEP